MAVNKNALETRLTRPDREPTCGTSSSAHVLGFDTGLRSRVKIKANKQVTSPRSELDQGETQQETAGRLISFWPLLLGVVSFFFPTLPPSETSIQDCFLSLWGFYKFYCFEKFGVV
jgi:hypothetical protein